MINSKMVLAAVLGGLLLCAALGAQEQTGAEPGNAISADALSANTWVNGQLTAGKEQQYNFTATAETQYIHVELGTLRDLYVQLHDSAGEAVGGEHRLYGDTAQSFTLSVIVGNSYHLRVRPYSNSSGTYKLGFNTTAASPGIWALMGSAPVLDSGTWADGQLNSGGEAWYKLTATARTQWFHIELGMLTDLYVQLYDSEGNAMGSEQRVYSGNNLSFSWMLISGNVYYVRVRPYSNNSGTYSVVFNTSQTRPAL